MGIISKIFSWGSNPLNDESTITNWGAGLILILALSFLWSMVVKQITE